MANEFIILQIFFITLGMVAFSMILNKIMGLDPKSAKEIREKAKNLQERMRNAQSTSDSQQLHSLQQESMQLYKEMMKKQLLPSCVRCFIFWGIFAIIGLFYNPYGALLDFPILFFGDGWVAVYFLFSIGISLLIYLIKRIYRKITGKQDPRKTDITEIRSMLSGTSSGTEETFQMESNLVDNNRNDSWKERIKN
ncbi:MAG: DUF106 domain-containing protein [Promethearchaeota archaeon]|nr:MAG: DUF106 domain-containing protein [Candidatus Lokiarchaeota archaeon]